MNLLYFDDEKGRKVLLNIDHVVRMRYCFGALYFELDNGDAFDVGGSTGQKIYEALKEKSLQIGD